MLTDAVGESGDEEGESGDAASDGVEDESAGEVVEADVVPDVVSLRDEIRDAVSDVARCAGVRTASRGRTEVSQSRKEMKRKGQGEWRRTC